MKYYGEMNAYFSIAYQYIYYCWKNRSAGKSIGQFKHQFMSSLFCQNISISQQINLHKEFIQTLQIFVDIRYVQPFSLCFISHVRQKRDILWENPWHADSRYLIRAIYVLITKTLTSNQPCSFLTTSKVLVHKNKHLSCFIFIYVLFEVFLTGA